MTAALPVSVTPRAGESIESWLEHLADANGLTTAQLLTATGRGRAGTRYLTLAPSRQTITRLAALARVDEQQVYAATLAAYDGTALDLTGLDPGDRHSYRQVAARGWAPAHGTQICPTCLAEDGVWRSAWRLLIVATCTRHESLLVARCPSCRRPFRDQRHLPPASRWRRQSVREPARCRPYQAVRARPHHHHEGSRPARMSSLWRSASTLPSPGSRCRSSDKQRSPRHT